MLNLILDIDDTLADISHREPLIDKPNPTDEDWEAFFNPNLVMKDKPIKIAQDFFKNLDKDLYRVFFISGRPERLRKTTVSWLKKYYPNIANNTMYLRPEGNFNPSSKFKTNVFINEILKLDEITDESSFVFIDDDPFVLYVFSHSGLTLRAPECWDVLFNPKPAEKETFVK